MLPKQLIFGAVAALFFVGWACRKELSAPPPERGVYYWKTTGTFGSKERKLLDSVGVQRLYLRYFDVDWSENHQMPVPLGEVQLVQNWNEQGITNKGPLQVAPVVYITNRVFLHQYHPDTLAARISQKVREMTESLRYMDQLHGWPDSMREVSNWDRINPLSDTLQARFLRSFDRIQLDCDWTPATQKAYFAFLEAMKRRNPDWHIHCTVRMHQYRDPAGTGIPPVDRGLLMCYNLAPVDDYATRNAIFDETLFRGYLKAEAYPLPLDVALPLFSWGALFHEGQFKGLAQEASLAAAKADPNLTALQDGRFRFLQDTVYQGVFIREGDEIRIDEPDPTALSRAAELLGEKMSGANLLFFDWNPEKIRTYDVAKLWGAFEAAQ